MKKKETMIVAMSRVEIPLCPYCGGEPIVEVDTKKHPMKSDEVTHQEASCPCCGLSAPMNVWCTIADEFKNPIAE